MLFFLGTLLILDMTFRHSGNNSATTAITAMSSKGFLFYVTLQNLWLRNVRMSTNQLLIAHSGRPHDLCFKTVLLDFLGIN